MSCCRPIRRWSAGTAKSLFQGGIALVTLALAFEAAIVPFQVWAPDVYQGAPTPVTAFMAVGPKVGAMAAFVRVFMVALPGFDPLWNEGLSLLIYPMLIYANYVALRQTQLRRFFAYSGISHAGFLLIAVVAGGPNALTALLFYLVVYAVATIGSFAVVAYLDRDSEGVAIADPNGLFRRSPYLAGILALCLLTLAGIPPTIGFFAKFYLFQVAFEAVLLCAGDCRFADNYPVGLRLPADRWAEFSEAPQKQPLVNLGSGSDWSSLSSGYYRTVFYPAPLLELLSTVVIK